MSIITKGYGTGGGTTFSLPLITVETGGREALDVTPQVEAVEIMGIDVSDVLSVSAVNETSQSEVIQQ